MPGHKEQMGPHTSPFFQQVQERQGQLGWSDEELIAFANKKLRPLDPYGHLQIATLDFLSRLTRTYQEKLVGFMNQEK